MSIFINIYAIQEITRNSCKKCNTAVGLLVGIKPVILVQHSNQLSYRGQLSSCYCKFMYVLIFRCAGCDKVNLKGVVCTLIVVCNFFQVFSKRLESLWIYI